MRKILITSFAILLFTTFAFAGVVTHGGFQFEPQTKTSTLSTAENTDTTVWTPASDNKIVLMGVMFSAKDTTGCAELQLSTKVNNVYTTVIPEIYASASGVVVIGNGTPIWKGDADETLVATTTGINVRHSVLLWGYETTQ